MKVTTLDEGRIQDIGHAFGYYDYGTEHGLIDAFPSRDAAAAFICGYVRMALAAGMLYTTSENGEGYIAFKRPGERLGLRAALPMAKAFFGAMGLKDMIRLQMMKKIQCLIKKSKSGRQRSKTHFFETTQHLVVL